MSKVSQFLSNKILGLLPSSWKAVQFSDLYDSPIRDFGSFSSTKEITFLDAGVPFIKSEMIKEGYIDWSSTQYISSDVHTILNKSYVRAQTILFSKIGSALGKAVVYEGERGECNSNAAVAKILLDKRKADNYFYTYALNDGIAKKQFYQIIVSLLPRINLGDIDKLVLPLPPLPEQRKIAQILSTWDKAITTTERLLANRQQQKKALIQRLLTGKQRFAGFEGEWQNHSLGSLGSTFNGLTGKTKEDFGTGKQYIPYINIYKYSVINLNALEFVKINDGENQSKVILGDIFFTTSSETPDEVGMSSVLLEKAEDVYLNSFCFGFRLNDFDTLYPTYASFLLRSEFVRRDIAKMAQGATRYNLSKKQLMGLQLILPPIDEQQKIASVLSAADAEITTIQHQLDNLKQQKKALMQQLLTGKRRVKVDSPALATQ